MPSRTCFGKPRSCCYGCLRVCGHGIMISPVKVKCELRSLELCESEIILPHSASSAAKTNRSPHLHTLGTIPAGEKWMLGWGFMFSQPCGTWAHLSSFAHSSTCVYAVQAAIHAHGYAATKSHSYFIVHLKLKLGSAKACRVFSTTFFTLFQNSLLKMRDFEDKTMSFTPTPCFS